MFYVYFYVVVYTNSALVQYTYVHTHKYVHMYICTRHVDDLLVK